MSPDPTMITRAEAIRRRKEEEARRIEEAARKSEKSLARQISESIARPTRKNDRPVNTGDQSATIRSDAEPTQKASQRSGYAQSDFGNSTESRGDRIRKNSLNSSARIGKVTPTPSIKKATTFKLPVMPKLKLPKINFNSRWVALSIALVTIAASYLLLYTPLFAVQQINVTGSQNINPGELIGSLGVMEKQLITLNWEQTKLNILATYPDISNVKLEWGFPNVLNVHITERIPIAEWHQEDTMVWIDAQGYAFPVRNNTLGLTIVQASSPAPAPTLSVEQSVAVGAKPFIFPELADAIRAVASTLPQGTILMYQPDYGLGWTDPQQGWEVFYGNTNGNNEEKMAVYKALVADLTAKNIRPIMINVEYPNAPFYKTEDEE